MTHALLVELRTEELPPKALKVLGQTFAEQVAGGLARHQLRDAGFADCRVYATPRRLAVWIPGVPAKGSDRTKEETGPAVAAPPAALAGFARKHGIAVEALGQRDTPKGRVVVANVVIPGAALDDVLAGIVSDALKKLPIPKLMRWGAGDSGAQFVRPVHGLVMLHGARVVPGVVLGLHSGNQTLGHRFLSGGPIVIRHADDYEKTLLETGKVVASFPARRSEIINKINALKGSAEPVASDALYDEITALVEAPTVYEARFDDAFLDVPPECLILSMQQHQKYVPLRDAASGKLLSRFLFVANLAAKDPSNIIHGNERVLRARLSDAKFFYDQDRRTRLEDRVPGLASVVYHNKLGSQLERIERIQLLAGKIARELGADPLLAERAAWLSKADLVTGMVGEFPELQGVMGRYYARHDGEPAAVADAVGDHYRPRYAGDALPQGPVACAVALADKLEALAGLFGIGQVPTGDKDPFGLRRAALGVIRILIERDLPLALDALVDAACGEKPGRAELLDFVYERLSGYLRDRGFSALEVDSVVSQQPSRIHLVLRRVEAVRAFAELPEAASLAAANKRARNILRKEAVADVRLARRELLAEDAEKALAGAIVEIRGRVDAHYGKNEFVDCLKTLAGMRTQVDDFFDKVLVNAEDRAVRENRLALLSELNDLLNRVADISRLAA